MVALIISGVPSSAGTNYESLVISIFKAIGVDRFVNDISLVSLRPTKRSNVVVPHSVSRNRSDLNTNAIVETDNASISMDDANVTNPTNNASSAASTSQDTMLSLLVRLKSPTIRYDIVQLKVAHNGGILFVKDVFPTATTRQDFKIFSNEWLPPNVFKLWNRARDSLKHYYAVWIRDGQIFARKDVGSERILINSNADLDNLLR